MAEKDQVEINIGREELIKKYRYTKNSSILLVEFCLCEI